MVEAMLIDLKALMVEREDCDAGTVSKLREALAQGGTQYRTLRDVTEVIKKKIEGSTGAVAKRWHLKLGIASFFLGYMQQAAEQPPPGRRRAGQLLPRPRPQLAPRVRRSPSRPTTRPRRPATTPARCNCSGPASIGRRATSHQARSILDQARRPGQPQRRVSLPARQLLPRRGRASNARSSTWRKAEKFDPGHTGALFQLAHANDLAGNDDEAISFYERCLKHPPVHVGMLKNLGVLYEDHEKYDKAGRVLPPSPGGPIRPTSRPACSSRMRRPR